MNPYDAKKREKKNVNDTFWKLLQKTDGFLVLNFCYLTTFTHFLTGVKYACKL